jgi:hypothetical protein
MLANHSGNIDKEYRLHCTVRQLILWRRSWGLQVFREYIDKTQFEPIVWEWFYEQYKLGNTGKDGEWLSNGLSGQRGLDI